MITALYHPGFAAPIGDHIMPMRKFALVAERLIRNPAVETRERDRPGRSSRRPADWSRAPGASPHSTSSRGRDVFGGTPKTAGGTPALPRVTASFPQKPTFGVRLLEPAPVTEEDLLRVHTPEYINAVRTGSPRALAESQKFPWSPALFPSVALTNGACVAAARQARCDGVAAALASGFHHAHADHGEGFCTFNGLVVAADSLRAAGEVQTVAILDLDLHYGNGTAALAVTRPYLTVLSIYGNDYQANVAYRDVTVRRHEDGPNHTSVALPSGCDGRHLNEVLEQHLPGLLRFGKPDLLLYQAGADPLRDDPYSPLDLSHDDLLERDRRVFAFARRNSLPIAWVLAGGYTSDITKVVEVHLNTFRAAAMVFGD